MNQITSSDITGSFFVVLLVPYKFLTHIMSTCELTDFAPQQCHENDLAQIVLVHCPGIESLLGSLHACGSLFEKPVNLEKARNDHQTFQQAMSDKGIKVLTVRQILGMVVFTLLNLHLHKIEL